ncbi:hypothetical protein ACF0H5_014311 [Mactra antiquata]
MLLWPVSVTVTATAPCVDLATYKSCQRLLMKLKTLHFLNDFNKLNKDAFRALNKRYHRRCRPFLRDLRDPDFEIYVDASRKGMGAYLLRKDNQRIYWWSEGG